MCIRNIKNKSIRSAVVYAKARKSVECWLLEMSTFGRTLNLRVRIVEMVYKCSENGEYGCNRNYGGGSER
jgi:hypothetical protein